MAAPVPDRDAACLRCGQDGRHRGTENFKATEAEAPVHRRQRPPHLHSKQVRGKMSNPFWFNSQLLCSTTCMYVSLAFMPGELYKTSIP